MVSPLESFLDSAGILHVAPDGQMRCDAPPPRVLLPGSFNPLHQGHAGLADVAAELCGAMPAFELSVANVDKPTLTGVEIRRRLTQFHERASVWLTHAPRFLDKAACFPGVTFVVGADTALRIVLPRYYDDDAAQMMAALHTIAERGCRFLVACRVTESGQWLRLADLPIPPFARALFEEIAPERFRCDISSTALRGKETHG